MLRPLLAPPTSKNGDHETSLMRTLLLIGTCNHGDYAQTGMIYASNCKEGYWLTKCGSTL